MMFIAQFFGVVLAIYCVSQVSGVAKEVEIKSSTYTAVFAKKDGETISLDKTNIKVGSRVNKLSDCSSEEYYCYNSKDLGFFLKLPKLCKNNWLTDQNLEMEIFMVIPHTEWSIIQYKNNRTFMYLYSEKKGIRSIYYNDGNMIYRDNDLDSVDFAYMENFEYEKISDGPIFRCIE